MAADTEKSGTRIFHQVRPSGWAGSRTVLQLVPAESTLTHAAIASSVRVVPVLMPRGNAPAVLPNTNQNHSSGPSLQILPPSSCSATIRTFLPKSTKAATRPETLMRTTQPAQSEEKTVIIFSKPKNDQIVKPHATPSTAQLQEVPLLHTSAHPITLDTIRTFSKVPQCPQTPNSPIQWVVKGAGRSPNPSAEEPLVSPVVVSEGLDVVAKREQRNKTQVDAGDTDPAEARPECSVLMFDDKIFFRVEKQETKEGEPIDLCRDEEVSDGETPADEESVKFVSYTPAPAAVSRVEDGTGTCTQSAQASGGTSTDPPQATAASCSREGHTQRSHTPQPQVSSGPSPAPCPVADHKLKQMFGITSEVEIRLPRVVSCDAHTSVAFQQAPPPDYTEPIEEDFLCVAKPPHARDCPQVEGSASRVGRTRKRTKCPCCSPAVLHLYHQKRRAKPGHGERRETARRQLRLPDPGTTSECTPVTAPQIPRKQAKLLPAPVSVPLTASVTTPLTTPQFVRKQTRLKPPPGTTAQIPRKPNKPPMTPEASVTAPQITQTPEELQSAPGTAPVTTSGTTPPIPQKRPLTAPSIAPLAASLTTRIVTQLTTPVTTPLTPRTVEADKDSEEMQIHKEIERLREALRLKEAALEKFRSDKNR